jgi:hypothetical protein
VICYQTVANYDFKRCLTRLQKGVTKSPKGHLLQAKWALFASRLVVFTKSIYEKLGQNKSSAILSDKVCFLHLDF